MQGFPPAGSAAAAKGEEGAEEVQVIGDGCK